MNNWCLIDDFAAPLGKLLFCDDNEMWIGFCEYVDGRPIYYVWEITEPLSPLIYSYKHNQPLYWHHLPKHPNLNNEEE